MGSLVSGWDTRRPGLPPKGFEDFKEPVSPRAYTKTAAVSPFETSSQKSGDLDKPAGPPHLARTSAPPMHGASAVQRYLTRASGGSGTSAPVSPRVGTPRAGSMKHPHLTLKIGDTEEGGGDQPLRTKEKWCSRVESAGLNVRPDEGNEADWRHGSFKLDDTCHTMHIPPSPTAAAAAAAAAAPVTPPASTLPVVLEGPRVTASRVPKEAIESFESAGL